jgi:hypothetical protein
VTDDPSLGPAFDLEVAAATLMGDTKDVRALLKALAAQLAGPLGDRLKVQREGGIFRKSEEVKSLSATIGSEEFEAELNGASIACLIGRASGGIRIRSDRVDMDEWLRRLLQALQAEAAHSESARLALEKMVIGGP